MNVRTAVGAALLLTATLGLSAGTGCSRDDGPAAVAQSTTRPTVTATLPFERSTQASLGELLGIRWTPGTADFLTAQLGDRRQLDVTLTVPAAEAGALLGSAGLPEPRPGERVVRHSSPLWKLNPDGELRGATTTVRTPDGDRLRLAYELVDEPGGRVRVRLVVTPA